MTDAEQDRTYYMQRTVFAKGPDGRVRLTKGDETPAWYSGKYDGREHPDDADDAEGGAQHPAAGDGDVLTQEQADALAALTEDEQAALAGLSDADLAELGGLTDEQLAELAATSAPEPFTGTDAELIDGSVDAVLDRVGADRDLAQRALDAEMAKGDKARSTLVEPLTAMVQPQA